MVRGGGHIPSNQHLNPKLLASSIIGFRILAVAPSSHSTLLVRSRMAKLKSNDGPGRGRRSPLQLFRLLASMITAHIIRQLPNTLPSLSLIVTISSYPDIVSLSCFLETPCLCRYLSVWLAGGMACGCRSRVIILSLYFLLPKYLFDSLGKC